MSTPPTEPVYLPLSLTYGKVMGRFLLPVSDGPDEDRLPDGRAAVGLTVTLTPETLVHRVADEGIPTATTVLRAPVEAIVGDDGQVRAKDAGDALPGLWVVTGTYKVTYGGLSAWSRPPAHIIEVTEAHTETSPLDLTVAQDTPVPPGSPVTVLQVTGSPVVGYVVAVGADGTLTYAPAEHAHDHDDRYVRTVNGTGPDGNGDVAVGATVPDSGPVSIDYLVNDTDWYRDWGFSEVRRVGNVVELSLGIFTRATWTGGTTSAILRLPVGYSPTIDSAGFLIKAAAANLIILRVLRTGWVQAQRGAAVPLVDEELLTGKLMWLTNDPFPTP